MDAIGGGEIWESTAGPLGLRRSYESIGESDVLVIVELTNDADEPLGVRVIEDVPNGVESTTLVTSVGGDPTTWRHVGDWILHEAELPAGETRRNAYLLETAGEPIGQLPAPRIRSVERRGEDVGESSARTEMASAGDGAGAVTIRPAETAEVPNQRQSPVDGVAIPEEDGAILDALLDALESNTEDQRRQKLQAALGLSPSERARFDHVQSRLDDLSAYVDALELLVDEHGIDAVEQMQDAIADNEDRTETLREDLEQLETVTETHRADTVEEIDDLREDFGQFAENLEERLSTLEAAIEDAHAELETLQRTRRADRQARARELRELHDELSSVDSTIDSLESDVAGFEAFRERFTRAFSTDRDPEPDGSSAPADARESVHSRQ